MLVREVMNKNIKSITPDRSVVEAATQMRDGDFGVMPVCEGEKVIGMITDRDIAVRAVASGKDVSQCMVRDAMTAEALTCFEDDDLSDITKLMSDRQIRRVPVLDRKNQLVGIVSVGDMARADQATDQAGIAMSEIAEPRHDEPSATVRH